MIVTLLVTMNKKKKKAEKRNPLFRLKLNKRVFVQNTLTVNLHKLNARDLKLNARIPRCPCDIPRRPSVGAQ